MPAVEFTGPLFDGRAAIALNRACDRMERVVASWGADVVRTELPLVLRNPTGYYQDHITAEANGNFQQVTDQGVIYGPWLEGTGSRNRSTRFKGYATFRRSAALVQAGAAARAEPVLDLYMDRVR